MLNFNLKILIKKALKSLLGPQQVKAIKSSFNRLQNHKTALDRFKPLRFYQWVGDLFKTEVNPVELLKSAQPSDSEGLKAEYYEKGLDQIPDNFVVYRIIGNDLYPRHKKGQSRENLRFILEHESDFEHCEKAFIVNRIIDQEEEKAIIKLLEEHRQRYIHIKFCPEEYERIGWDTKALPKLGYFNSKDFYYLEPREKVRVSGAVYRLKNNYVMNNNGARNTALRDGKSRAKWILPWDGNCFIAQSAWEQIRTDVTGSPYLKYFVVPMARILDNRQLLRDDFIPEPVEEPQLIFRKDSSEEFNEEFPYGRRPKVELFWRLGIPGKWDRWGDFAWDLPRRPLSAEARQFGVAGWVARLFSGMETLEKDDMQSFEQRGSDRLKSIMATLRHVDTEVTGRFAQDLSILRFKVLEGEGQKYLSNSRSDLSALIDQLIMDAEEAMNRGPYSVIDKTTLPPSGVAKDYWHPAPYWWPNPDTPDGLPYINRDGIRVPGTRLYEPESDKYDRTRLQLVFDDSIMLALAWRFTKQQKYADHAARIMERFFVNSDTGMNPHLKYAQVRMGHDNNMGSNSGIIEMKDLYYYLDAVRLLVGAGVLTPATLKSVDQWLETYLDWLLNSPQGLGECMANNNHGSYYDLQVASVAAFLGRHEISLQALARAQDRIGRHFKPDGSQPQELERNTSAHYCCFNFQSWINIAEMASRWGFDLWSYQAPNGASLIKGAQWLLSHLGSKWPYQQIDQFDYDRFYPVWFVVPEGLVQLPEGVSMPDTKYQVKAKFFPHDGIRPYWNLG